MHYSNVSLTSCSAVGFDFGSICYLFILFLCCCCCCYSWWWWYFSLCNCSTISWSMRLNAVYEAYPTCHRLLFYLWPLSMSISLSLSLLFFFPFRLRMMRLNGKRWIIANKRSWRMMHFYANINNQQWRFIRKQPEKNAHLRTHFNRSQLVIAPYS